MTGSLRTFRFAAVMRRQDLASYDVLHAHGEDYWMWRRRVPVHVRTLHGSCFEEAIHIPGLAEKLRMVLLGFTEVLASIVADRTVLISPQTRRWTPWVRTVIPNGVDGGRFAPDGTPKSDTPTVLFVGTWKGRKRGAELGRIFAEEIRPRIPSARLRMVTRDAPVDLPEGIEVLGRLDDDELADEYRRAWAFCLPSAYEGFGIPYAEAMTAGTPVVATPNPGARYVTDNGRFGVLANLHDVGAELVSLLLDPDERSRWGDAARGRARAFDLRAIAGEYERLYRLGLTKRRRHHVAAR